MAFWLKIRETVMSKAVLTRIFKKRTLNKKCRLGSRVRVTVMTKAILSLNDGKRTFVQKCRFGISFRLSVRQFYHKMMANAICTKHFEFAVDFDLDLDILSEVTAFSSQATVVESNCTCMVPLNDQSIYF